jgi:hypothetical protein
MALTDAELLDEFREELRLAQEEHLRSLYVAADDPDRPYAAPIYVEHGRTRVDHALQFARELVERR